MPPHRSTSTASAAPPRPGTRARASAPTRRAPGALDRALRFAVRHRYAVALGLAALHLALALLALQPAPYAGGDNAVYLSLGRSLLEGGYRDLYDPAAPRHAQFPPGYPAIVAASLALGVRPWIGLKVVGALFSAAAVALTYLWIRRRRRPALALVVAAIVAVSPGVIALAHRELSDVPFWALMTAALLGWERLGRRRWGRVVGASAATAGAYLVRSAGLPLVIAAAGWLAIRRRWTQLAAYPAIVVPPAAAWWAWTRAHGGYARLIAYVDPYAPELGTVNAAEMAIRVGENLRLYGGRFLPTLLTGGEGAVGIVLAIILVALAVHGWAMRIRRPGVVEMTIPLYVAMLLVWSPSFAGDRLLLPIFPALLLYAGEAAVRLGRMAKPLPRLALPAAATACVLVAALPGAAAQARTGGECRERHRLGEESACLPPGLQDFYEIANDADETLPAGSVVLSRKAALFWAASGVPGRTYPLDRTPEALLKAARESGARYVLLDQIDEVGAIYLTPVLLQRPAAFCVMYALGPDRPALFGIRPNAERIPNLRADPGAAEMQQGFSLCGPEYWRSEAAMRRFREGGGE